MLFEFVKLKPEEILELGQDFKDPSRQPTAAEISSIAEKKKQRSILLQSASALLTTRFRDWWKQGEYRFRFEADGNHFRIWVSDDKRPEEVELEGRSTGLQWFLSFYLVFLVERADAHDDAILLLDEPGLSLHPLAQRDLAEFFYSSTNTGPLREFVSKVKVGAKQLAMHPTLILDVVRKAGLKALWLPDRKRILIDDNVPDLKKRHAEGHEITHSITFARMGR